MFFFTEKILEWYKTHERRHLPWKNTGNAYYIWLSEIILQQTRTQQGIPYYERFVKVFPTVKCLASASQGEVMQLWQGLGYYARARNMHATAQYIANELNSCFPETYEGLLQLKGVGSYTAAAIASFAYNLPHAVLDGNVYRVLARFWGITTPIDTGQAKKEFEKIANELLPPLASAAYNQAIMDFGATQCTPQTPKCTTCILKTECVAYSQNLQAILPIKSKKMEKKHRYFNFFVIETSEANPQILIEERQNAKDIWHNLHQFLMLETPDKNIQINEIEMIRIFFNNLNEKIWEHCYLQNNNSNLPITISQTLTHQVVHSCFFHIKTTLSSTAFKELCLIPNNAFFISKDNFKNYAFPKTMLLYIQKIEEMRKKGNTGLLF